MIELPEQYHGLNTVIVGGYVRDMFIEGEDPSDIDLMVHETPKLLKSRGFTPIENESFPIFIDDFGREVSLPRTEQSTGDSYTDFETTTIDSTTPFDEAIERDLARRDLTINSMAYDLKNNRVIDPFNGRKDIGNGIIRHTTEAFSEDPLRVLRAARFVARFRFNIHENTVELMRSLIPKLTAIPAERVTQEMIKTFKNSRSPRLFFDVLKSIGAMGSTFPFIDSMKHIPAGPRKYHKEGSLYEHTMRVLDEMHVTNPESAEAKLVALTHDIGKLATPSEKWPSHYGHGKEGLPFIKKFAEKHKLSTKQERWMKEGAEHHMRMKNIAEMQTKKVFDLYMGLSMPATMLIQLCRADVLGREPMGVYPVPKAHSRFEKAEQAIQNITADTVMNTRDLSKEDIGDSIDGEKFGKFLRDARIREMKRLEHNS